MTSRAFGTLAGRYAAEARREDEIGVPGSVFRIGDFEVTSFGVVVAIAALVGIWLFGRELARSGLPTDAVDAGIAGVIGGLAGAKLLWTVEFMGEQPVHD